MTVFSRRSFSLSQVLLVLREDVLENDTLIYVVKRSAQAALTLLLASFLCFVILNNTPGEYLDTLRLNPEISPERIDALREQFRLDQPWYDQYRYWVWQIIKPHWVKVAFFSIPLPLCNFGTSFGFNRPVLDLLWERVPATLLLSFSSLFLTWFIALPLGIIAAVNQDRKLDRMLQFMSYAFQGIPSLIAALLLLILAQSISPWLPVGDLKSWNYNELTTLQKVMDILWHLLLPTLALSITSFAGLQRITRGQLLEVLRQDYIRTARSKGLSENRVIYIHALRNALNPLITLLGFEFSTLLSGAFVTEYFFNWPGLGRLILQAVTLKDRDLAMASLMVGAFMLILGNLLADLLLKFADPRIKLSEQD